MRAVPLLFLILLAGCIGTTVSRIDSRTYQIQDDGVPGGSSGPDRRTAEEICPNGYRVLDETTHRNGPDLYRTEKGGYVFTTWTVRCL
jgi:hypothetical protein